MTKVALVKFLVLFLFASSAFGQKVKYKDIFGLLNTKQYEAAEPFLKKYLKETDDNPNAFLYMGIIYQERSAKEDILRKTEKTISYMDSAIYFYDKAYKTITEKEVKRNDEYYQAYNRRDLRTGEFGVKLSDIQYDVEKRMEGLRERIDRVKMVKHYFGLSEGLYKKTAATYQAIQKNYPSEKAFFLRAEESTITSLTTLALQFDSCTKAFDNYKSSLGTVGKTSYNQILVLKEIKDFQAEGTSPADFYKDELALWDYKKFADRSKVVIEKEIIPMQKHLISYDIEINKLREKLSQDSVSVRSDLTNLIDKLLMDQLKKYDPEPLPMEVFTLKISDLEYRSALMEHRKSYDTTDVNKRLQQITLEAKSLAKLDSISNKMTDDDIDKKAEDYNYFITNTFSNTVVLKSYVEALKEYSEREQRSVDAKLKRCKEALRWIRIYPDSVPLFTEKTSSRFKPLAIEAEKYTSGLQYKDSLNADGYLFTITPSRVPDVKVAFPVEKHSFREGHLNSFKSRIFSDAGGQLFFVLIFSERAAENKYPATLAKIYRSDGLAWSNNFNFGFIPTEISFKQDTGELIVKGSVEQAVVDKNGKLLK